MKRCVGTIAYPTGSPMCWDEFAYSFAKLVQFSQEFLCQAGEFVWIDRSFINDAAPARNSLVKRMRGDWLFQTDWDHQFEPDLIFRLLHRMKQFDAQVVTGIYHHRTPPYAPVLFNQPQPGVFEPVGDWPRDRPFGVAGLGAGCMLVKREVFTRIHDEIGEEPFERKDGNSEDLSFFARCSLLGIRMLCDPRIQHRHLMVKAIGSEEFQEEAVVIKESSSNILTSVKAESWNHSI